MWVIALAVSASLVGLAAIGEGLVTFHKERGTWFTRLKSRRGLGILCLLTAGFLLAVGGQYKLVRLLYEPMIQVEELARHHAAQQQVGGFPTAVPEYHPQQRQEGLGRTVGGMLIGGVILLAAGVILLGQQPGEAPSSSSMGQSSPATPPELLLKSEREAPQHRAMDHPPIPRSVVLRALQRGAQWYATCAILCFSMVFLFVLLNVVLYVAGLGAKGGEPTMVQEDKFGPEVFQKAYPELSKREIQELHSETAVISNWMFEPYVQYKEPPFLGKWVKVDENGYRHTKDQGPWPPDPANLNIFMFGGSTMFGIGVSDEQTIASYLQETLQQQHSERQVKVYNFGRCGYYSTPERILFEKLLTTGVKPDVAVFLDGINDSLIADDVPAGTDTIRAAFNKTETASATQAFGTFLSELPVRRIIRPDEKVQVAEGEMFARVRELVEDEEFRAGVIERYFRSKRLIEGASHSFGVRPAFVWQPSPTYKYDSKYHLFAGHGLMKTYGLVNLVYADLEKHIQKSPKEGLESFLWLADIQEPYKEPLYIDRVHYSGKFSKELAGRIGRFLLERKIVDVTPP